METLNDDRREESDTERRHVHIDRSSVSPAGAASSVATRASVMPAVNVYIPTPFRKLTGNRQHVRAEGRDVDEVLANVEKQFPGFRGLVFGSGGEVPAHINIYVNKQEINSLQGIHTKAGRRRRSGRDSRDGRRSRQRRDGRAEAHRRAHSGAGEPLLAAHHHAAGRAERAAQDHGIERADHRRRRPRLADRRVPGARRHRQDRHRRLRHRRHQQPAAADPAPERRHRQARRSSPPRRRSTPTTRTSKW